MSTVFPRWEYCRSCSNAQALPETAESFLFRVTVVVLFQAVGAPRLPSPARKQWWGAEVVTSPYKDVLRGMFGATDATCSLLDLDFLISN